MSSDGTFDWKGANGFSAAYGAASARISAQDSVMRKLRDLQEKADDFHHSWHADGRIYDKMHWLRTCKKIKQLQKPLKAQAKKA